MSYCEPFPAGTPISQRFGDNPGGVNPSGGHTGTDYAVTVGTPIHAAAQGTIEYAGYFSGAYDQNPYWYTPMGGLTIVLNCGWKDYTFGYAHCSESLVNIGDTVTKGQIIGYSGNTGTATTGPHCHTETLPPGYDLSSPTYGRINPLTIFDEYPTEQENELSEQDIQTIRADINTVHQTIIRDVGAQLSGLREAINQLATKQGQPIDLAAVTQAAQAGAEQALQNIRLTKDHS